MVVVVVEVILVEGVCGVGCNNDVIVEVWVGFVVVVVEVVDVVLRVGGCWFVMVMDVGDLWDWGFVFVECLWKWLG